MSKISLVIEREFMTRVKKKSFIVTTLLSPILFAALMVGPTLLATLESTEMRTIAVVDETKQFQNIIPETDYIKFKYLENTTVDQIKNNFPESGYYAVLHLKSDITALPDSVVNATSGVTLYSDKQPSIDVKSHIEHSISKELETRKLKSYNIENLDNILKNVKSDISVKTIKWTKSGEAKTSSTEVAMGVAYVLSFLVYMMIFMFGTQVMRGVIEEKTNRIVEVIVSSVKPFQLMMGKIVGIALVCLVQILAWIVLTFVLVNIGSEILTKDKAPNSIVATQQIAANTGDEDIQKAAEITQNQGVQNEFLTALGNLNFPLLIGGFLFYFLGGFLLYAAMFAAVGSAVDNETDTQQLILPITIPLILAILVMISGIKSPDGPLAFWFSMIPFTSPIIMLTRLPFGVPEWQLALSAFLLIVTFIVMTWLAGKIYRTGILLYGKKYTWGEIWKWIRYSN